MDSLGARESQKSRQYSTKKAPASPALAIHNPVGPLPCVAQTRTTNEGVLNFDDVTIFDGGGGGDKCGVRDMHAYTCVLQYSAVSIE